MARLDEIFDLQMGKTPSRNNADYWIDGQYDWVSIADLGTYQKYVDETKEKISALAVQESGIKSVPANTVIMSFKLSLGKTAITQEPIYTNEAIMAFIPTRKYEVLPDYFYHLFSAKDWTKGTNRAVMGTTLNKATLGSFSITVPSLTEQRKIAAVLDKVSGLISKRRQQLDKLDELVKSRFIEIYGVIENNPFGLPTKSMVEICQIIDGDRGTNYPKQEDFSENGYCLFLNAKNVTSKGFSFDTCMYITQEKDNQLRKGKLARGDVVLTTRGTIGNLAFYDDFVPYDHVRINSGMVILRMDRTQMLEKFFIEQFKMQLSSIKEKIASGSAQPQLPISTMNKIKLLLPPIELQQQFVVSIEQTDKSKLAIQKSLQKLETLKKALMQKYFG